MDELITQFAEIGIIGVIAFVLFKNTLESHKQQVKYLQDEVELTYLYPFSPQSITNGY